MGSSHADLSLQELEERFFDQLKQKGRSSNTLKNYRTDLDCFKHFLNDQKHSTRLADFTMGELTSYGQYLDERYSSDNSRRRRVQALRLFFDFLVEQDIFPSNPVRKLPTSPKFLDRPRPTPLIDVKTLWHALLDEARTQRPLARLVAMRNQVVFLLIYEAGLKVSDLVSLRKRHLFLDQESPRVLIEPEKRDPYTVPLPAFSTKILEEYFALLTHQMKKMGLKFDHVLFNANPHRILSGGLTSRGLEMIFEDYRKRLIIQLTPKSLRQSCIFHWLTTKHSESQIKEWLGVAPSYSLKPYTDLAEHFPFPAQTLEEIFWAEKNRKSQ